MEACVSPGMFSQMVAPHKALVTHWTVEALLARVCAIVARQLIRSGELLPTVWPGTFEGALTCGNTRVFYATTLLWAFV